MTAFQASPSPSPGCPDDHAETDRATDRWNGRIELAASAEAAVVFSSLAAQCVGPVCDRVVIDVTDAGASYRIAYPPGSATSKPPARITSSDTLVRLRFAGRVDRRSGDGADPDRGDGHRLPRLDGVATFFWDRHFPSSVDRQLVAALIDLATLTIAWQRSEQRGHAVTARADNLQLALQSSRDIGAAVGILMSRHQVTQARAFDLLRVASQNSNRKLRELALEVIDTC